MRTRLMMISAGLAMLLVTHARGADLDAYVHQPDKSFVWSQTSNHDTANGGILVSASCDKVYTQVERGLNSAGANALRTMGARLLPQLPVDEAQAKVSDSLVSVYGKTALANAGATAGKLHRTRCARRTAPS